MPERKSAARKPAKKAATPVVEKKAAAAPSAKQAGSASLKKSAPQSANKAATVPAAPLRAHSPKKTGDVATRKSADTPKVDAPYQPKTEPPQPGHNSRKAMPVATPAALPSMINPLAIAAPWMRLGYHMTMANFALQSRMARAAFASPATVLRQSSEAYSAWVSMMSPRKPEKS